MPNLADILTESAAAHSGRVAVKRDERELTYAELDEATALVAGLLRAKGVRPGDRVGIMLPNVEYFAIVYYGALRAGAAVVPMNVLLKEREVAFHVGDSGAALLFAWHQFADAAHRGAEEANADIVLVEPRDFEALLGSCDPVREVAGRDPRDTAVILYTSGTTGTPKGAELTHSNLKTNCQVTADTLVEFTEDDVVLGALPLFHSFGQTCGMNTSVYKGSCLTLIPRFEPKKAMEMLERDKVTIFQGVPTMYIALLNLPEEDRRDTSSLRLCVSGGSAMPVEVLKGFEEAYNCKILEGYGLSETS